MARALRAKAAIAATLPPRRHRSPATLHAESDDPPTHQVSPGETLSEIAKGYGVDMDTLMLLNGISDPDTIVVGQRLRLPAGTQLPAAAPTSTPVPEPESTATPAPQPEPDDARAGSSLELATSLNRTYTVAYNDTLADIALRVGVDVEALHQLNQLPPAPARTAGQTLLLPAAARTSRSRPRHRPSR